MIKLITGAKGTGKTKKIIDLANDNVESAKGVVVFVTDTDRYMYSIRYQVRVINTACLKREGESLIKEDVLIGFLQGILASNHDIESFYLDGAHRMLGRTVAQMEDFFTDIYKMAKDTDTVFYITVSENEENFPEFLTKYQGE